MQREPVRLVQKLGESLLVCIPAEVCRDMNVKKGDRIRFDKVDDSHYGIIRVRES